MKAHKFYVRNFYLLKIRAWPKKYFFCKHHQIMNRELDRSHKNCNFVDENPLIGMKFLLGLFKSSPAYSQDKLHQITELILYEKPKRLVF